SWVPSFQVSERLCCVSNLPSSPSVILPAQVFCEEIGHERVRLLGFGEFGIIPEGVREGLKDDQLRVDAGAQIGTMQDGGAGQKKVAAARNEKGRRKTVEVGIDRREHGILGIAAGREVFGVAPVGIRRIEMSGQAIERKKGDGVSGLTEIAEAGEDAGGG